MAEEIITILCYWNGKITLGSHGLAYEGPPPKPIRVNNRISYKGVVDEIYNVTGFHKIQMGIKITCRYPSNFKEYIAVPVEDNNTESTCAVEEIDEADEGIDGEEYIVYEQAPIPGFTNIDQINDAVVDASMQGKECPQKDDGELYIGQRFTTKDEMQTAVKLYSLRVHPQYQVANSSPHLWVVKCKQAPKCPWRLRASIPRGASFFKVKKYDGPHTCINPIINRDHLQLDSGFVAGQIKSLVKAQLSITLTGIEALITDN
ncbi:hypothetical protein OROHE_019766 [Orobanche hederae]